jgi:hypothetical protein
MNLPREQAAKILLALDIACQNLAAREFALSLAGRLQAELIGLFVEDEDLLASAQYPFSREIVSSSASERKLNYDDMERSLRAWSTQMQQQLMTQAKQANVKFSFQTFRGKKTETLLQQTVTSSLLIFSGLRSSHYSIQRRAHTAYVLVDDDSDLQHSVTIIKQLTGEGIDNVVFINTNDINSQEKITTAVDSLSDTRAQTLTKNVKENLAQQIAALNKDLTAAVVLVPATHKICQQMPSFKELQNYLSCPVVVVN